MTWHQMLYKYQISYMLQTPGKCTVNPPSPQIKQRHISFHLSRVMPRHMLDIVHLGTAFFFGTTGMDADLAGAAGLAAACALDC